MDEHHKHPERGIDELDQSARAIADKRGRVREFAAAQRQELDRLDAEITGQLDRIRDELRREHTGVADHRDQLVDRADQVRLQSEEIRAKSEQLAAQEAELEGRRRQLDEAHEQTERELEARRDEFNAQTEVLDAQCQEFAARTQELEVREQQWHQRASEQEARFAEREVEIEQQRLHLETVEAKLHHEHRVFEVQKQECLTDAEETSRVKKRAEDRLAVLEQDRAELEAERARTAAQRDRIARELKEQRDTQLQEIERRREELETLARGERSDLEQALAATQLERQQLESQFSEQATRLTAEATARETAQEELTKVRKDLERLAREGAELQEQSGDVATRLAAAQARIEELEAEHVSLIECAKEAQDRLTTAGEASVRLCELESTCEGLATELAAAREREAQLAAKLPQQLEEARRERETLIARVADAETRVTDAERRLREAKSAPSDAADLADLKRRHEMLMDDLRELKKRNQDLEKKVASGSHVAPAHGGGGMDWEAQKSRMLAALEADDGQEDDARRGERLKIEEAIRATDAALADKNTEIGELQRLLAQQSDNLGSVAVGAAAFGDMLDKDAIVCQERERLKQLQGEWEDKLRQAEVELSVQRAQIARARVELDERQRTIDSDATSRADDRDNRATDAKGKKSPRGRWLSRLGLKDDGDG